MFQTPWMTKKNNGTQAKYVEPGHQAKNIHVVRNYYTLPGEYLPRFFWLPGSHIPNPPKKHHHSPAGVPCGVRHFGIMA